MDKNCAFKSFPKLKISYTFRKSKPNHNKNKIYQTIRSKYLQLQHCAICNLKLSIQKHKYSLPHFLSNQTNTKADTDTQRERERDSSTNPIKLAKAE